MEIWVGQARVSRWLFCQNRLSSHLLLSLSLFSKWVWQVEWAGGSTQHSVCHSHLSQTVFWAVQGNEWVMTEKWLLAPRRLATSEKPRHHLFRGCVQHKPAFPVGPAPQSFDSCPHAQYWIDPQSYGVLCWRTPPCRPGDIRAKDKVVGCQVDSKGAAVCI